MFLCIIRDDVYLPVILATPKHAMQELDVYASSYFTNEIVSNLPSDRHSWGKNAKTKDGKLE